MKKDLNDLAKAMTSAKDKLDAIRRYVDGLPNDTKGFQLHARVDLEWASSSCPDGYKAVRGGLERRFNVALREEIAAVQAEAQQAVSEAQNALIAAVSELQNSRDTSAAEGGV